MQGSDHQPDPGGTESGSYCVRLTATSFTGRPCLFLDRDGVVVKEVNYLHRLDDVAVIDGVAEAIALVNRAGLPVVMVTNQAGIGRGIFGWEEFLLVQREIIARCRMSGAHFDMVLACPFHAEGIGPYAVRSHPWRKPNPGMLLEAARVLKPNLERSVIIGDTLTDLAAGEAAGLAGGVLVLTGHGERDHAAIPAEVRTRSAFARSVAPNAAVAITDWLRATMAASGAA